MGATTVSAPTAAGSWATTARVALAALIIVGLLAGAFVLGRVTVGTDRVPVRASTTGLSTYTPSCHVGRPC